MTRHYLSGSRYCLWATLLLLRVHGAAADEPLRLSCTTSHLGCVAQAIGGPYVQVTTIVPFGMCPGHFDLNPREAEALTKADLVLCHGFERFLDDVKAAQPGMEITRVAVAGNWMVSEVQEAGAKALTQLLCEHRPAHAESFRHNLTEYLRVISQAVADQVRELETLKGTRVICSSMNRDVVESLGLGVHAVFPRDEDISAKDLTTIVLSARQAGVRLVIDNRQSSGKVGRTLATELGVPWVLLTNFPPEGIGKDGYAVALEQNRAALLKAGVAP